MNKNLSQRYPTLIWKSWEIILFLVFCAYAFDQHTGYFNLACFGLFLIGSFYSYSFSPKIAFHDEHVIFPVKGYWNWNTHDFYLARYEDIYVLDILKTKVSFFSIYHIHFKAVDGTITSVNLKGLMLKKEIRSYIENELLAKACLEFNEEGVLGKRFAKIDSPLHLDSLKVFTR